MLAKVAANRVIRSGERVGFLISVRNRGRGLARRRRLRSASRRARFRPRARGAVRERRRLLADCGPAGERSEDFSVRVMPVRTNQRKVIVNVATVAGAATSCSQRVTLTPPARTPSAGARGDGCPAGEEPSPPDPCHRLVASRRRPR